MAVTAGIAGAQPLESPPQADPGISVVADPQPVEDPDTTMHQCNALIGALVGAAIGGTGSALPGALIGAAIGAAIGWSLLYPPGPPLACWQPTPAN
ncbi:hypothetical protein [Nocardia huaxiensis]|uniref:Glycine zipper domain-containing protein n=1 Tax=Nocardia huaxiensis TaxID=2755382 RepID=A0A7D6ZMF6_9NOCA|nr:hypothetical protein [Nocardia huaxiensis]QLY29245.1 hypothetical protein H0264_28755 [Nocardia huaxiensis]UFS97254.1 hypothetical protein LPY97_04845 [Nocardia huaxiensis]